MFVNLKKAYDSVPHVALWTALGRIEVPDNLIMLIRSFNYIMQM